MKLSFTRHAWYRIKKRFPDLFAEGGKAARKRVAAVVNHGRLVGHYEGRWYWYHDHLLAIVGGNGDLVTVLKVKSYVDATAHFDRRVSAEWAVDE